MPWEKTFDEDTAVEAAMLLFWEKGYTDTSMADLLKATEEWQNIKQQKL